MCENDGKEFVNTYAVLRFLSGNAYAVFAVPNCVDSVLVVPFVPYRRYTNDHFPLSKVAYNEYRNTTLKIKFAVNALNQ